jgi:hypothetical protein
MAEREKEKRHRGPVLVFSAKGSRKNNFPEFAHGFVSDWGELREHNRRRSKAYVEDCVSKDRPKMT